MWLLIVFVSVHDGYLVLANRPVMTGVEQNPLGRWLLERSGGDIWLLLSLKSLGTVAVATFLLLLRSTHPRIAFVACAAIAAFQVGLLIYLYSN